jgi:hypothetical protein
MLSPDCNTYTPNAFNDSPATGDRGRRSPNQF